MRKTDISKYKDEAAPSILDLALSAAGGVFAFLGRIFLMSYSMTSMRTPSVNSLLSVRNSAQNWMMTEILSQRRKGSIFFPSWLTTCHTVH